MTESERIKEALEVAVRFGGIDGDHHKAWVIDQMVRALTGCEVHIIDGQRFTNPTAEYTKLVADACDGEDGSDTYDWKKGTPP